MNCKYVDSVTICGYCKTYMAGDPTSEVIVADVCKTCQIVNIDNEHQLTDGKPNKVNYERMWLDNGEHYE